MDGCTQYAFHPPCSVEMKVTRSPSATAASSSPLHSCKGENKRATPSNASRDYKCKTTASVSASDLAGRGLVATQWRSMNELQVSGSVAHHSSQSVSFSSTSTPGRLHYGAAGERRRHDSTRDTIIRLQADPECKPLHPGVSASWPAILLHSHAAALHEQLGPLSKQVVSCPSHCRCNRQVLQDGMAQVEGREAGKGEQAHLQSIAHGSRRRGGGSNQAHLLAVMLRHIGLHHLLIAEQQLHAAAGAHREESGRRRDTVGTQSHITPNKHRLDATASTVRST